MNCYDNGSWCKHYLVFFSARLMSSEKQTLTWAWLPISKVVHALWWALNGIRELVHVTGLSADRCTTWQSAPGLKVLFRVYNHSWKRCFATGYFFVSSFLVGRNQQVSVEHEDSFFSPLPSFFYSNSPRGANWHMTLRRSVDWPKMGDRGVQNEQQVLERQKLFILRCECLMWLTTRFTSL